MDADEHRSRPSKCRLPMSHQTVATEWPRRFISALQNLCPSVSISGFHLHRSGLDRCRANGTSTLQPMKLNRREMLTLAGVAMSGAALARLEAAERRPSDTKPSQRPN